MSFMLYLNACRDLRHVDFDYRSRVASVKDQLRNALPLRGCKTQGGGKYWAYLALSNELTLIGNFDWNFSNLPCWLFN